MIRWVKLIAPYAILFVLSIPGSALPPTGEIIKVIKDVRTSELRKETWRQTLPQGPIHPLWDFNDREDSDDLPIAWQNQQRLSGKRRYYPVAPLEVSHTSPDGLIILEGKSYPNQVSSHNEGLTGTESDGVEEWSKIEERLRIMRRRADKVIESAAMVADYHADAALQIRTRYPREEVPMNVESHIEASDAARQEVRNLRGTVTMFTPEETTKAKASRASSKATEAQDEHCKAEKAATDDAH